MAQFLLPASQVTAISLALRHYARVLEQARSELVTPKAASGGAALALEQEQKLTEEWLGKIRPGHEYPHEHFDVPTIRFLRSALELLKTELSVLGARLAAHPVEGDIKLWGVDETLKKIDEALQGAQLELLAPAAAPTAPPASDAKPSDTSLQGPPP